jgi:hypothetical protein
MSNKTLSSLWPMIISATATAAVAVYLYKQRSINNNSGLLMKEKDCENEDENEVVGGTSTDLHGRPWKNMKKSEKAQWWAANGQIDKDTLRILESTKDIIVPDTPISADNIQDWLTVYLQSLD